MRKLLLGLEVTAVAAGCSLFTVEEPGWRSAESPLINAEQKAFLLKPCAALTTWPRGSTACPTCATSADGSGSATSASGRGLSTVRLPAVSRNAF